GCETAGEVVVVVTTIRVITLNQSTRRREVFGNRQQQSRVVIQLERKLYEAFAEGRFTDDERAIVILKRPGDDFSRGSRIAVYQDDDGNRVGSLIYCRI